MKQLFINPHLDPDDNGENPLLWNKQNLMIWGTRDAEMEFTTFFKEFGTELYDARDTNKNEEHYNALFHGNGGNTSSGQQQHHYLLFADVCDAAKFFLSGEDKTPPTSSFKHVLFAVMNENWGAFSEYVTNKTINWIVDLKEHWVETGCSLEMILNYLSHPNMLLAVTMQFQIWDLYPKVISLPLGVKNELEAIELIKYSLAYNKVRNSRHQLLMINCQRGTTGRDQSIENVISNFKGTPHEVQNTFPTSGWHDKSLYYQEMQQSKFILTPGGLGFDCYRIWEAITMGTIPIVETLNRTDGWFHTFDELPVAIIDSYNHLTPQWLEDEYQRIISRPKNNYYNYHRLTKPYWINLIKSHVTNATTTAAAAGGSLEKQ